MEVLETAAASSGRPFHLLEKDVWVVWALSVLFASAIGAHLSFKGGTSLSKVYRAIDRSSEDIDLTYDVRTMIPELAGDSDGIPPSRSQGQKWTESVRERLPDWIADTVSPLLTAAMNKDGLSGALRQGSKERLFIDYPAQSGGHAYVKPAVMLEFGARSTGEPTEVHEITCDAAAFVPDVSFPVAHPRVMALERTFWEKATAAHVYCVQAQLKGERFARHWHDLAALARTDRFESAIGDRDLALKVARQKKFFFREKAADGSVVDYEAAVNDSLLIVPTGQARAALEDDYNRMVDAGLLHGDALPFEDLMQACQANQDRANAR